MAGMWGNVYVAAAVVVLFGVTIFVHEFGHFLAARLCGFVVRAFSVGFGPAVWKTVRGGVTYRIGAIPFGGYVALPQLDPSGMSLVQGKAEGDGAAAGAALPRMAPWRKIVVSVSGAAGNMLLAVGIAWLVYLAGMPATTADRDTVVGYVERDSAAARAGLRVGDRILSVNGAGVDKWSHFVQEASMSDTVELAVRGRDGADRTVAAPTEEWQYGLRMLAGVEPRGVCEVSSLTPGMSAEKAGMRPGDVIVEFGGEPVLSRGHLIELVEASRDRAVVAVVERREQGRTARAELEMTPRYDSDAGMTRIGIVFRRVLSPVDTEVRVHPRPWDQLRYHASGIFRFLGSLVTPRTARRAANLVGGPVAIVTYYIGMIKASLMLAVWFTGFLNVNLAIINLLPMPVLDGGHVMFSLWEWVRRRPPHVRVVNALVNVFSALIILLFLSLSVRDLDRYTPVGRFVRGLLAPGGDGRPAPPEGAVRP